MGLFKKLGKKIASGVKKVGSKIVSGAKGFKNDVIDSGALSAVAGIASKVASISGTVLTATGIGAGVGAGLMAAGAGLGVASKVLEPATETDVEAVTSVCDTDLASLTMPSLSADYDLSGVSAVSGASSGGVPASLGASSGGVPASSGASSGGVGALALLGLGLKILL